MKVHRLSRRRPAFWCTTRSYVDFASGIRSFAGDDSSTKPTIEGTSLKKQKPRMKRTTEPVLLTTSEAAARLNVSTDQFCNLVAIQLGIAHVDPLRDAWWPCVIDELRVTL